MNNDITQLLFIATVIVPFINAIVALIRKSLPNLKSEHIPFISVGTGIALGAIFFFLPSCQYSIVQMLIAGGISGIAACGVYDIAAGLVSVKNSSN